jgi:Protein of unknown function (DUF2946)
MLYCNVEAIGVYRLSARGVIGMQWVRSNIRLGARTALFALAVQLALSFGHFHAVAAPTAPSIHSTQQQPAPSPDSDQHPDDVCAICAVIALASTAMAAAPPALPIPQAYELAHPPLDATFVHVRSARTAFQSRAPPLT